MKNIIFLLALLMPTLAFAQTSPHCDYTASNTGYSTEFVVSGKKWNCYVVTYKFMNGTLDMAGTTEWDAVRQAFAIWQPHTNLVFREVFGSSQADIRISWEVGAHGDGNPFVGTGGVFAHAFSPPPTFGDLAGDIHFDDSETWVNVIRGVDANQPHRFGNLGYS